MNQVPESRSYTHDRCEQMTVASGDAFTSLASPLADLEQTYCHACKSMFPIAEFRWSESDETLPDYCQRHGGKATMLDRFIASRQSIIAAMVVAVAIGIFASAYFFFAQGDGLVSAIACGVGAGFISFIAIGGIFMWVLTPLVHKRVCGVSDPRKLV